MLPEEPLHQFALSAAHNPSGVSYLLGPRCITNYLGDAVERIVQPLKQACAGHQSEEGVKAHSILKWASQMEYAVVAK